MALLKFVSYIYLDLPANFVEDQIGPLPHTEEEGEGAKPKDEID